MTIGELEERCKDLPKDTEIAVKISVPGDDWAKFVKVEEARILSREMDNFKLGTVFLVTE